VPTPDKSRGTVPRLNIATETSLWQELADLVHQQRDLILTKDHVGLSELNELLEQKLAGVVSRRDRPRPDCTRRDPASAALNKLQRRVCTQAAINRELIADALAYADFTLELLYPQARSAVYSRTGQVQSRCDSTAVNRSA